MVGFHEWRLGILLPLVIGCTLIIVSSPGVNSSTNQAPIAQINSILPFPALANSTLIFNGSGIDDDGYIVRYEWDFDGDGKYDWNSTFNGTTEHEFYNEGI